MAIDQEDQTVESSEAQAETIVEPSADSGTAAPAESQQVPSVEQLSEATVPEDQPQTSAAEQSPEGEPDASAAQADGTGGTALPELARELAAQEDAAGDAASIDLLKDVELNVKIELGRTRMFVEDVLKLGNGSVVELDKLAGDPVDIYVNERLVARGEVLVLNDNFCVRVSQIVADNVRK